MSFSEPDTDILVPAFDVRALARRAAVPAAVAAAAAAALVVAGGPLHAFAHALRRALDADPRWVIGGAIFELLSFAGYVALFWMVGSRATERLGLSESTQVTLGGAAATRLLPTAGVGGAAMTLWALRRAGLGSARRHADAAGLPHRPLLGLPRRDRRLGRPHRARDRLRATGRSR